MTGDFVEHLMAQWAEARPELDTSAMAVVGRIMRVSALLERRLAALLEVHGLSVWEFDVMATLRRNGDGLPPKRLLQEMLLSSGALTNRIDRLESRGLVKRTPDPSDRRGVIVRLTARGRRTVDPVVANRFEDAREVVEAITAAQARALAQGLHRLAQNLEDENWS